MMDGAHRLVQRELHCATTLRSTDHTHAVSPPPPPPSPPPSTGNGLVTVWGIVALSLTTFFIFAVRADRLYTPPRFQRLDAYERPRRTLASAAPRRCPRRRNACRFK